MMSLNINILIFLILFNKIYIIFKCEGIFKNWRKNIIFNSIMKILFIYKKITDFIVLILIIIKINIHINIYFYLRI